MVSGTQVKTTEEIIIGGGNWIDPGTPAVVVGVAVKSDPPLYLCHTCDEFAEEEFVAAASKLAVA